jgi:hypothetical protein
LRIFKILLRIKKVTPIFISGQEIKRLYKKIKYFGFRIHGDFLKKLAFNVNDSRSLENRNEVYFSSFCNRKSFRVNRKANTAM